MKISDVRLEMELGGVDSADIADIVELCKSKGVNSEMIDDELIKRGYEKIFTVDYDMYEDDDAWGGGSEYASKERFPHKNHFID